MGIVHDMSVALDRQRRDRASKRWLGIGRKPAPIFRVGARDAFIADFSRLCGKPAHELLEIPLTLFGVPVEFVPIPGWVIEWR